MKERMLQELRDGCLVADLIKENWEEGDLAFAVRLLMDWRKSAGKTIARAEARS